MPSSTPPAVPSLSSAPKQPKLHGRRTAEKRKTRKIPLAVLIIAALVLIGGSGGYIYQLQTQLTEGNALFLSQKTAYEEQILSLEQERDALHDTISGLEVDLVAKSALLASREGFLANLAELHDTVVSAEGKINTTEAMGKAFEAQDLVYKEASSIEVVEQQQTLLKQETENLKEMLVAWELEQARQAAEEAQKNQPSATPKPSSSQKPVPPPAEPTPPRDPLSTPRQALNDVGGSWVTLSSADMVCNMSRAVACATTGHITIATKYVNSSYGFWYDYMMHEYAHQIQFNNWGVMKASPFYQNAFNSDPEWLATCMAEHRKPGHRTGYNYSCSSEQMAYASRAWNNDFSG